MEQKPAAHFENREYFYSVESKSPTEIIAILYSTRYHLIKTKEDKWVNHPSNKNSMAPGLINALVEAINKEA
ncbi:hypothetical protein [Taibaiella chishuiensis]|uniref:Uncharacterized protein n=1 Tax=Taibaiella chishuiensis TaxID=1434707 RepID=A0A2P8D9F8_9BACT|nr:hypothetical protein [Taibaiella chishuiensis]PSK93858.1 hypothetical protein B0I18_1016 [Taibaiella chishuiensis]